MPPRAAARSGCSPCPTSVRVVAWRSSRPRASTRVACGRSIAELFTPHGEPALIRSDTGGELTASHLVAWLAERGAGVIHIDPGSPRQTAYAESFHARLRNACLSPESFASSDEARVIIEAWPGDFSQQRPHSSLGSLTPEQFLARWRAEDEQEKHGSQPQRQSTIINEAPTL